MRYRWRTRSNQRDPKIFDLLNAYACPHYFKNDSLVRHEYWRDSFIVHPHRPRLRVDVIPWVFCQALVKSYVIIIRQHLVIRAVHAIFRERVGPTDIMKRVYHEWLDIIKEPVLLEKVRGNLIFVAFTIDLYSFFVLDLYIPLSKVGQIYVLIVVRDPMLNGVWIIQPPLEESHRVHKLTRQDELLENMNFYSVRYL